MDKEKDLKKAQAEDTKELKDVRVVRAEDLKNSELNKMESLQTPEGGISGVESEQIDRTIDVTQPNVVVGEEAEKLERDIKEKKKEKSDKDFDDINKIGIDAELAKKEAEKKYLDKISNEAAEMSLFLCEQSLKRNAI